MLFGNFTMKEDKNRISWCWRQKSGIKLEQPNDNLCNVYVKKAMGSLNMLESAVEKKEINWIPTMAYYARYFSFYALLQKCGIKSEIHDCTISLMYFLFVEEKLIEEQFYKELLLAKELRVETQYYVTNDTELAKIIRYSESARIFVLKMEEVIENITKSQIKNLRSKLVSTSPRYHVK